MNNKCGVCGEEGVKFRVNLLDGFIDVCSKECGRKELLNWIDDYIEEL